MFLLIGDLDNDASLSFYREARERFGRFLSVQPRLIARDLHPDYLSSVFARTLCEADHSLAEHVIQHHQAHMASVMAEKGLSGPAIGFTFDGTGLGLDGHIWGGECFVYDRKRFHRAAHFEYFRLPGGDAATREPWRIALALLKQAGISRIPRHITSQRHFQQVDAMIDTNINCPRCCSVGRLFDGIAALIGLRTSVTFEAQAAIALEALATRHFLPGSTHIGTIVPLDNIINKVYNFNIKEESCSTAANNSTSVRVISVSEMIRDIYDDCRNGTKSSIISARLHETLSEIIVQISSRITERIPTRDIVLSGGVFQNRILLARSIQRLAAQGFTAHYNTIVPPNDGGIALGQAWITLNAHRKENHKKCV